MEKDEKSGHLVQNQMPPIVISKSRNQNHPKMPVSVQKPEYKHSRAKRLTLTNYNGSLSGTNSTDGDDDDDDEGESDDDDDDVTFIVKGSVNSASEDRTVINENENRVCGSSSRMLSNTDNYGSEDGKTVIENDQKPPQIYFVSLLMDPSDMSHNLLRRICEATLDDDQDQGEGTLAFSLVNFFQKIDLDLPFVKWCLDQEIETIRSENAENTLFRGSTFPMKIYSMYCSMVMNTFLNEVVKEHITRLSEIYSVDPDNFGSQASVSSPQVNRRSPRSHTRLLSCEFSDGNEATGNPYSTVTANKRLSAFLLIVDDLLRNVIGSLPKFPKEIRSLVRHVKNSLDEKFGESPSSAQREQNTVNSLVFLRIICPCVALPDVFGILDKESVMASSRKNFRLASALIQSIANGGHAVKSLGIEENALTLFMKRNQHKVNDFLTNFSVFDGTMSPEIVRPFVLGMSPTCIPHKPLILFFEDIKDKMSIILPHLNGYPKFQELMDILNMSPTQFSMSPPFISPPPLPATTPLGDFNLNSNSDLYQNRFSETASIVSGIPTFENDVFTHLLAAQKSLSLFLSAHAKKEEEMARKLKEKDAEIERLKKEIAKMKSGNPQLKLNQLCDEFDVLDDEVANALDCAEELSGLSNDPEDSVCCAISDLPKDKPVTKLSADLPQDELYKMALFYKSKYTETKRKNKEVKTSIRILQEANERKTESLKVVVASGVGSGKKIQFETGGLVLPCVSPNFVEKDFVTINSRGEKISSPPGCDFQVSAHGRNFSSAAVRAPSDMGVTSVNSSDPDSPLKKTKDSNPIEQQQKQQQQQQLQTPKKKRSRKKEKASKK